MPCCHFSCTKYNCATRKAGIDLHRQRNIGLRNHLFVVSQMSPIVLSYSSSEKACNCKRWPTHSYSARACLLQRSCRRESASATVLFTLGQPCASASRSYTLLRSAGVRRVSRVSFLVIVLRDRLREQRRPGRCGSNTVANIDRSLGVVAETKKMSWPRLSS